MFVTFYNSTLMAANSHLFSYTSPYYTYCSPSHSSKESCDPRIHKSNTGLPIYTESHQLENRYSLLLRLFTAYVDVIKRAVMMRSVIQGTKPT